MRALLEAGAFVVCVDGDEDFLEEYAPEDEGTEWRRRVMEIEPERRAHEWMAHTFVRPRMPRARAAFLLEQPPPATVQVQQDGGW